MKKIAHLLLLIITPLLLVGAGAMYPSTLGTRTLGSHYVSPNVSNYSFALYTDVPASVIALRITPLNNDPEIKKWCFDTRLCSIDDYVYDTSQDYILYAGANGVGGYLFWEPNN